MHKNQILLVWTVFKIKIKQPKIIKLREINKNINQIPKFLKVVAHLNRKGRVLNYLKAIQISY